MAGHATGRWSRLPDAIAGRGPSPPGAVSPHNPDAPDRDRGPRLSLALFAVVFLPPVVPAGSDRPASTCGRPRSTACARSPRPPARGAILDRHGTVLIDSARTLRGVKIAPTRLPVPVSSANIPAPPPPGPMLSPPSLHGAAPRPRAGDRPPAAARLPRSPAPVCSGFASSSPPTRVRRSASMTRFPAAARPASSASRSTAAPGHPRERSRQRGSTPGDELTTSLDAGLTARRAGRARPFGGGQRRRGRSLRRAGPAQRRRAGDGVGSQLRPVAVHRRALAGDV